MKKGLVLIALCVAMLFGVASSASAQAPNEEYKAVLGKLLEASGSMSTAKSMVPQIIAMVKQQSPSVASTFWDGYQKKWEDKFGTKLVELYAPIYYKHLTLDDLKKIVAFYESPVGKKMGTATPAMMTESMQMGQQLGMEIVNELQKELQVSEKK